MANNQKQIIAALFEEKIPGSVNIMLGNPESADDWKIVETFQDYIKYGHPDLFRTLEKAEKGKRLTPNDKVLFTAGIKRTGSQIRRFQEDAVAARESEITDDMILEKAKRDKFTADYRSEHSDLLKGDKGIMFVDTTSFPIPDNVTVDKADLVAAKKNLEMMREFSSQTPKAMAECEIYIQSKLIEIGKALGIETRIRGK